MNELALFAGAGGGILGGWLLGWSTVCAVEIEPYAREILLQRQRDGMLAEFPIWDDVRNFDGRPWRGLVDVVSGGFPCQDISAAGRGAGIGGERSGLWKEMLRIIREVRPRYAFVENSPMLSSRGLGTVLGGLAESGYNAAWLVLGADEVGAPHQRKRMWILAEDPGRRELFSHSELLRSGRWKQQSQGLKKTAPSPFPDANLCTGAQLGKQYQRSKIANGSQQDELVSGSPLASRNAAASWWATEPDVGRMADGVAARVDRLKAIGNGQVPLVAATAFCELKKRLERSNNENT